MPTPQGLFSEPSGATEPLLPQLLAQGLPCRLLHGATTPCTCNSTARTGIAHPLAASRCTGTALSCQPGEESSLPSSCMIWQSTCRHWSPKYYSVTSRPGPGSAGRAYYPSRCSPYYHRIMLSILVHWPISLPTSSTHDHELARLSWLLQHTTGGSGTRCKRCKHLHEAKEPLSALASCQGTHHVLLRPAGFVAGDSVHELSYHYHHIISSGIPHEGLATVTPSAQPMDAHVMQHLAAMYEHARTWPHRPIPWGSDRGGAGAAGPWQTVQQVDPGFYDILVLPGEGPSAYTALPLTPELCCACNPPANPCLELGYHPASDQLSLAAGPAWDDGKPVRLLTILKSCNQGRWHPLIQYGAYHKSSTRPECRNQLGELKRLKLKCQVETTFRDCDCRSAC